MRYITALLVLCAGFTACRPETYTPKPRGYYEIKMPERGYQLFNDASFPYSFEYPVYGKIRRDTTISGKKPETQYWINIDFPTLGGSIFLSYKTIKSGQTLAQMMDDSYAMTYFHTEKADNIEDRVYHLDSTNVHGILSNVTGNAASAYQFYATDSNHNFMRGALYFDVSPNADSLKPLNDFLRTDIEHLIKTLRWK